MLTISGKVSVIGPLPLNGFPAVDCGPEELPPLFAFEPPLAAELPFPLP